jgi:hypothetical protein
MTLDNTPIRSVERVMLDRLANEVHVMQEMAQTHPMAKMTWTASEQTAFVRGMQHMYQIFSMPELFEDNDILGDNIQPLIPLK